MGIEVQRNKYEFHEYAPRWIKKYNIKGITAQPNNVTKTCSFYDDNNTEVAYISILKVYSHSVYNNNTVIVHDKEWLTIIKNMLYEWKRYYNYPRDITIQLSEYEEI